MKIILDLCGGTGSWSKPYLENGYDVRNITLPEYDVRTYTPPENVYGILSAPPCTMFSMARTNAILPRDLKGGMDIVFHCLRIIWEAQYKLENKNAHKTTLEFWALENPYHGFLKRFIGYPAFIFQPFEFGDRYKKHTALWGYFNEPVKNPIDLNQEELALGYTNSQPLPKFDAMLNRDIAYEGNENLTRTVKRAITPPHFAQAFYEANK